MKLLLFLIVGVFGLALTGAPVPTTVLPSQAKRELVDLVPAHLPIKIQIQKEHEEGFHDLNNAHWPKDFVLEVKNTGDRPIYALSLVWMLRDARAPDGNPYGATMNYGRNEFRTVRGESLKPEDIHIKPGETHVFKLSKPTAGGLESFAKDDGVPPLDRCPGLFSFHIFRGRHRMGRSRR